MSNIHHDNCFIKALGFEVSVEDEIIILDDEYEEYYEYNNKYDKIKIIELVESDPTLSGPNKPSIAIRIGMYKSESGQDTLMDTDYLIYPKDGNFKVEYQWSYMNNKIKINIGFALDKNIINF